MPGKIVRKTIADLAEVLKLKRKNNQGMVLFLGSRAGSLFRSSIFYDMMRQYSIRNFNFLSREEQFAECYRILQGDRFGESEIDTILTLSLQNIAIIEASICLAEFVKQELFDIIISTSIDTFLEDAMKDIGMKEIYHFDILIPGRNAPRDILYSDKKLATRIIKVFGDLPSRVYNLTRRDFYLDVVQEIKESLESILARDILVIGFDPVWDAELLRVFPAQEKSIWVVSEEEVSAKHPFVLQAKNVNKINGITGKVGSYEQCLKALYWHLSDGMMPTNYQLVRDTLTELRFMHNNLGLLKEIYDEVQGVHKKISYLQSQYLERNGGDII